MPNPRMFYFGVWPQGSHSSGHFLHDEYGSTISRNQDPRRANFPWDEWKGEIDGQLQPHGANCRKITGEFGGHCHCSGLGIAEGLAVIHHKAGWTALGFWDRSLDGRPGCNSCYFAEGTFTFAEMVAMAKARFAVRWDLMKFEVRENV